MELVLLETSSLSISNKEPADHRPNAFGSCTHRGVAALASLSADQKRSADPREEEGGLSPLEAQAPRGSGLVVATQKFVEEPCEFLRRMTASMAQLSNGPWI